MLKHLFNERKAAQAAAYLLYRAGRPLSVLKLMKLLYLAERRSFEKHGAPMIGDRLVSMDHGPVLSRVYNHMNGEIPSADKGWEYWISDRAGHDLALRRNLRSPGKELLELSDADQAILEETWKKFGRMHQWRLRDYTHRYCPEWTDPEGSMIPMEPEEFLAALKFSPKQIKATLARMREENRINAAFEAVRE